MARLSALVCAHSEDKRLAACLEALHFADEVVVVLDRCSDGSAEIARHYADRVVSGAFPVEGSSRIAGLEACKSDWVLEISAGEQIGPALAEEICDAVNGAIEADHFFLPIDHYAGVLTELRLYRRGAKSWTRSGGDLINPILRQLGDELPGRLIHLWKSLRADRRPRIDPSSHGQAAE
jgi:glycosyltransferase involved in cell wall biosynthesis